MNIKKVAIIQQYALPFFIFMAIILRVGTFFPSVINHDESTYILIGDGLLHGQTYLVDSFDTKPIGIFLIYALLNFLSGGSIFLMRLFTAAIIGITAYLLYRLGHETSGQKSVGLAAGLIYILLTSIFKFYGLSPNTELFFVPFAVGAIMLAWGEDRKVRHFFVAGLLLGLGFIIKYVIAADALALGLMLLWIGWQHKHLMKTIFHQCLPLVVGFFIPILMTTTYYWQLGQLDQFMFYTFEVTSKYPVNATVMDRLLFVLDFFGRFFPFTLLAIAAWRNRYFTDRNWAAFLSLWLVCVGIMTLLPGKIFGHYQIQLMPILALMAGYWFQDLQAQHFATPLQKWWAKRGVLATAIIWLGLSIGLVSYYTSKPDLPKEIAAILKEKLKEGETVYTGNYHHIVYHLLEQTSATPYVHSSLLFYDHHINALEVDLEKEAKHIVDDIQPRFVLLRKKEKENILTDYIYQHYSIVQSLPDNTWLLERKK